VQPAPQIQQPAGQGAYCLSVLPGYSNNHPCGSFAISNEAHLAQQYSNVAPVVTVQYEIQQPITGFQYATPVATANYGMASVAQHAIAHYAAQPYAPTSIETSVPAVVSLWLFLLSDLRLQWYFKLHLYFNSDSSWWAVGGGSYASLSAIQIIKGL